MNFVIAGNTDTTDGISLAAIYAVEYPVAPILTLSYGTCEQFLGPAGNQFWNEIWEQAAAEGISAFVASGDSGAAGCDGNAPDLCRLSLARRSTSKSRLPAHLLREFRLERSMFWMARPSSPRER